MNSWKFDKPIQTCARFC